MKLKDFLSNFTSSFSLFFWLRDCHWVWCFPNKMGGNFHMHNIPQVLRNTDERYIAHIMSDFADSAFGHTLWRVQNKWAKFSHWELVFCFVFVIIERNLRWKIILLKWHGALGLAASHSDVMKALSPTKWRSSIHFIPTTQPLFSLPAWLAALANQVCLLTTYFLKECP